MPVLPSKPFNPVTTPVPVLGPSSGNPQSLQDPKSLASIGSKIQAMTDQANADTLYDAKPSTDKEGYTNMPSTVNTMDIATAACIVLGMTLIISSLLR